MTNMMKTYGTVAVAAVLAGVSFGAGALFGDVARGATGGANAGAFTPEGVDLYPLWKAWHLLDERFVPATSSDPLTNEEKVYGMIQGLAGAYGDPYTVFLPPKESEQFAEDIAGEFGGVGMEVGMRDGILTVIAPLKNTPAQRAGILSGDRVIEIDGVSTQGMSVDEAIGKIRGEVGTDVVLSIGREGAGDLITITVTRAVIQVPTAEWEYRDDGIFVVSLYNFGGTAIEQFRTDMRELRAAGATKLIIDVRGNPGGYLDAAVDIASWFLPAGKVVVREDFGQAATGVEHRSKGYKGVPEGIEVVVLVDQGSASASEILAGALKDHGVATIVGKTTFGKGSVQELIDVTRDTSLKITIARWLTPNGYSISDGGLTPDVSVDMTPEDVTNGRDPQMDKAIELLLAD